MSFYSLTDDFFFISVGNKTLKFDRDDISKNELVENSEIQIKNSIISFLGIFDVIGKKFAVVSTNVESICDFWDINQITKYDILQITKGPIDRESLSLLQKGLDFSPLYYSPTHDLSLNLHLIKSNATKTRFQLVWNGISIQNFENITKQKGFVMPIFAGFITSFECSAFKFVLISRRSHTNAGVRGWMKGANAEGYTSNYVETEQIIITDKEQYSFIQTRGSVPLHWSQYPDITPIPKYRIAPKDENEQIIRKHFNHMINGDHYNQIIALNLCDHYGKEKPLTETYEELVKPLDQVKYIAYDFHTLCKHRQYNNIDKIIAELSEGFNKDFSQNKSSLTWTEMNTNRDQTNVVRTNCVDCLDRTNCVQAEIARFVLNKQIEGLNINVSEYDQKFRDSWVANSNHMAQQYAGTPGLKTDYTKTGVRSYDGVRSDIKNAVKRYFIGQCNDGVRQDAYDVVTQIVPSHSLKSENIFVSLFMAIIMIFIGLFMIITGQSKAGKRKILEAKMRIANQPRFRPIIPASDD